MTHPPSPNTPFADAPTTRATPGYVLRYLAAALAAIGLAPVPMAAALSASASTFEGGRGYAFIGYLPIAAASVAVATGLLYLWGRTAPVRRRHALLGLAGFDLVAAAALIYLLVGGF